MTRSRPVSNEVLLEKINQLYTNSKENRTNIEKLSNTVNEGFQGVAEVLQRGYVSKDELNMFKETVSDKLAAIEMKQVSQDNEISKRLHKESFKPYAWALNAIAGSGLLTIIGLFGKMLVDYIRGAPPQ